MNNDHDVDFDVDVFATGVIKDTMFSYIIRYIYIYINDTAPCIYSCFICFIGIQRRLVCILATCTDHG